MAVEPSLEVVVSRLETISGQLADLTRQIADDRRELPKTYVPRELYDARHSFLNRRIDLLEAADEAREHDDKEREAKAADTRRQLLFIALTAIAMGVVSIIVAVVAASGGG